MFSFRGEITGSFEAGELFGKDLHVHLAFGIDPSPHHAGGIEGCDNVAFAIQSDDTSQASIVSQGCDTLSRSLGE